MSAISNYSVPRYATEEDQVFDDQFYSAHDMAAAAGSSHVEPWIVEAVNREFDLLASEGISDPSLWSTSTGFHDSFPAVDFSPESIGTELPSPYDSPLFDQTATFDSFDASNQSLFPQAVPAAPVHDDSAALFSQVDAAFKDLARARAAADPRPVSRKKKQRDATIALYLERLRDTCNQAVAMLDSEAQGDQDLEAPFQQFAQPMTWQNSTAASDSSFIDNSSFSTISSPQSSPSGVESSSRASPAARTSPVTGGVEMVMDLNMNEATSLPRKHRPRTQAQRERYIAVRNQGACEKHKRQHKRCTCVDQQFTVTSNATQQQSRHAVTKAGFQARTQPLATTTTASRTKVSSSPDLPGDTLPTQASQAHTPDLRYSGTSSNSSWSQSSGNSPSGDYARHITVQGQPKQSLAENMAAGISTSPSDQRGNVSSWKRSRDDRTISGRDSSSTYASSSPSTSQRILPSSPSDVTCPRSRALREARNNMTTRSNLSQPLEIIQRDFTREDPGSTECRYSSSSSRQVRTTTENRGERDPRANACGSCSCTAPPHEPTYRVPGGFGQRIITRGSGSGSSSGTNRPPRPDRSRLDSCGDDRDSIRCETRDRREKNQSSSPTAASSIIKRSELSTLERGRIRTSALHSFTRCQNHPTSDTKSTCIAVSTINVVRQHVAALLSTYSRTLRWSAQTYRKRLQSTTDTDTRTSRNVGDNLQGDSLTWCLIWGVLLLVSSVFGWGGAIIAGSSSRATMG